MDKFEKYFDSLKKEIAHVFGFKDIWNKKDFLALLMIDVKVQKFKKGEILFLCGDQIFLTFFGKIKIRGSRIRHSNFTQWFCECLPPEKTKNQTKKN